MLQISTGKYFQETRLYETAHEGVLYTNYLPWGGRQTYDSMAGKLLYSQSEQYSKFNYLLVEKLEAFDEQGRPEAFASTLGMEMVAEYSCLVSFKLSCICVTLESELHRLRLSSECNTHNRLDPRHLLPNYFLHQRPGLSCHPEEFAAFVDKLLAMDRKAYECSMQAIQRYVKAANRIVDDLDAAYTLFVSAIESLAQAYGDYSTVWADVSENKRKPLDKALSGVDDDVANSVRQIIIDQEHHSIGKRFRDYTFSHLGDDFFRSEALDVDLPLSKTVAYQALKNTYVHRSKFIHTLEPLPSLVGSPAFGIREFVDVDGRPILTIAGLSRCTRHLIERFVSEYKNIGDREFNYRESIPGQVSIPLTMLHPRGWMHPPERYNEKSSITVLRGFLMEYKQLLLNNPGADFTDLTGIMEKIEKIEPGLNSEEKKLPMAILYLLFHTICPEDAASKNVTSYMNKYNDLIRKPSIYSVLAYSLSLKSPEWDIGIGMDVITQYLDSKHKKNHLELDSYYEAGMFLWLGGEMSKKNLKSDALHAVGCAIDAFPGNSKLIYFEKMLVLDKILYPDDWKTVIG